MTSDPDTTPTTSVIQSSSPDDAEMGHEPHTASEGPERPRPIDNMSMRAFGALMYLCGHPDSVSAKALAKQFSEGERAARTVIGELKSAGYVESRKDRIGGQIYTRQWITELGYQAAETAVLFPLAKQNRLNSNKSLMSYSSNSVIKAPTGSGTGQENEQKWIPKHDGEIISSGYIYPAVVVHPSPEEAEEIYRDLTEIADRKRREFYEACIRSADQRRLKRNRKPRNLWTCEQVVYEFADRANHYYKIPPWQVNKTRFTKALTEKREVLNTNGEVECEAIERFFRSISVDPYNDAEHLWKMFISRLPSLAPEIMYVVHEDDPVSEASLERTRRALQVLLE